MTELLIDGLRLASADAIGAAHDARMAHVRAILAKVLAGRSTLRSAALALGLPRHALPDDLGGRRLAVFRAYTGAAVRTVSPLALRICAMKGVELDEVAMVLRPGMGWGQWICGVRPSDVWLRTAAGAAGFRDATDAQRHDWALQEWLHGGWPVYGSEYSHLLFGVRVLDAGLEMAAFLGDHRLRTHGLEGSITLRTRLPDTIMAALPGVALDRFIDHPLINGAGCVVTGVDEPSDRWGTKVRFALDPVPWRMPWTRDAAADRATLPVGGSTVLRGATPR